MSLFDQPTFKEPQHHPYCEGCGKELPKGHSKFCSPSFRNFMLSRRRREGNLTLYYDYFVNNVEGTED